MSKTKFRQLLVIFTSLTLMYCSGEKNTDDSGDGTQTEGEQEEIVAQPLQILGAEFTDYQTIEVEFADEGFEALLDRLDKSEASLSGDEAPTIESISKKNGDTNILIITLSDILPPKKYSLSISNDASLEIDDVEVEIVGVARFAFVTEAIGPGNLSLWTNSNGKPGILGANSICQNEADDAGFVGEFKAFLAYGENNAYDHFEGEGPWFRTDSHPFVKDLTDLRAETDPYVPLNYHADGEKKSGSVRAWTGTNGWGERTVSERDCDEWTSDDSGTIGGTGDTDGTLRAWSSSGTKACDQEQNLYCFQLGSSFDLPEFAPPAEEDSIVFLSSANGTGNIKSWPEAATAAPGATELEAADMICQTLATSAGLNNPNSFMAWLSTSTTDAIDRLSTKERKFVLRNGVKIASSRSDLVSEGIFTAITIDETGTMVGSGSTGVWTGTRYDGTKFSATTCSDWTSSDAAIRGTVGIFSYRDRRWTESWSDTCDRDWRLYCFEN